MNQKQNDFDQWIRNLADEAESPFHEASWLKMEELLDSKKKKRIFWWVWPLGIGSTILVTGLIYFFIHSEFNSQKPTVVLNTSASAESKLNSVHLSPFAWYAIKSTIQHVFDEPINTNEENISVLAGVHKITSSTTSADNRSEPVEKGKNVKLTQDGSKPISNKYIRYNLPTRDKHHQNNKINEQNRRKDPPVTDKAITLTYPGTQSNKTEEIILNETLHPESVALISSGDLRNSIMAAALDYNWPLLAGHENKLKIPVIPNNLKKPKTKVYSAIVFSVHVAPEITTVPSRTYGSASKEYGFNISYQFTPNLSLSTGLQKTNKLYSARQGDYEITYNDHLYNKVIENIDGMCKVVEWPVTIGYKFRALGNNYFQLNAGLASTRMDKESYGVDYSYWKGGKVIRKDYNFSNKNWEMWSSAVFSLSYIKPISKHFSFTLNPYLKTPLKGIGNGNVSLKSVGSQFGINYSIPTSGKN